MVACTVLVCVLLLFTFYQDMRYRGVYWWVFPLLFLTLAYLASMRKSAEQIVEAFSLNTMFIVLQLFFLLCYLSLKNKKIMYKLNGYLGLGDILFILVTGVYFSVLNFMLFYLMSLVLVVIAELFRLNKHKTGTIPLAGYQSVILLVCMLADWKLESINLLNDHWLLGILNIN